jgi:hypothetical protein
VHSISNPPSFSGIPKLRKALVHKLENDLEGKILLISIQCGVGLEPSAECKARLRHEFGLYAMGWSESFGLEHLEGPQAEEVIVRMIASESI